MEELLEKLVNGSPWSLAALFAMAVVFLWRQNDKLVSRLEKVAEAYATFTGEASKTTAALTTSLETANRSNEARLDTLKNLVANGEASEKIMGFLLDEMRRIRGDRT